MTNRPDPRRFIRTLAIELIVYGVLLAAYFVLALRFLGQPLTRLLEDNLTLYAIAGLSLIFVQGAVLDAIASFLVRLFGRDRRN